jgi:hypothetical protein
MLLLQVYAQIAAVDGALTLSVECPHRVDEGLEMRCDRRWSRAGKSGGRRERGSGYRHGRRTGRLEGGRRGLESADLRGNEFGRG